MPFYPMADVTQHGRRLLVMSLSSDRGRHPNEWYRILPLDASDDELAGAVMGAFERSKREPNHLLPKPSSREASLESDRLGLGSYTEATSVTTQVSLTLVDGEVFAAPYTTVPGRGYSGGVELPPARGTTQVAQRVREALAEAARRSAHVVDHDEIAATQTLDGAGRTQDVDIEDPQLRSSIAQVDNLTQVVVTRFSGRWAVESVSTMPGTPPAMLPNGWVRACASSEDLPATIVEGLLQSEKASALPQTDSFPLLLDALGATSDQTGAGLLRIAVEADRTHDELTIWPQERDDEGRWQNPENPELRVISLGDPTSIWVSTIEALADDVHANVGSSGRDNLG